MLLCQPYPTLYAFKGFGALQAAICTICQHGLFVFLRPADALRKSVLSKQSVLMLLGILGADPGAFIWQC